MTWLTRFAQVVAGRTHGKWEWVHISPRLEAITIFNEENGSHLGVCHIYCGEDAEFACVAANVADEVLLVIKEAEHVQRALIQEYGIDVYVDNYSRLHKALAKLAAKVEQV